MAKAEVTIKKAQAAPMPALAGDSDEDDKIESKMAKTGKAINSKVKETTRRNSDEEHKIESKMAKTGKAINVKVKKPTQRQRWADITCEGVG